MSTDELRTIAGYHIGIDLPARLAHADDVVRRQSQALLKAADEIDSLRAMVVTLTREIEHCKAAGAPGIG